MQADVCHAYHTLRAGGMPSEHIIVLSPDDAATSPKNPHRGKLFSKPDGADVRAGCAIDYAGAAVSPQTFLSVLSGNRTDLLARGLGSGRVLQSTSADRVFVYVSSHGGEQVLGIGVSGPPAARGAPAGSGPAHANATSDHLLHAAELMSALKRMHASGMFHKLTFYLEACQAGTMFPQALPPALPLYALTATDDSFMAPSLASYCPPNDDVVQGEHVGSCLGDLFSTSWLEDTDAAASGETLDQQFQRVGAQVLSATGSLQRVTRFVNNASAFAQERVRDFVGAGGAAIMR